MIPEDGKVYLSTDEWLKNLVTTCKDLHIEKNTPMFVELSHRDYKELREHLNATSAAETCSTWFDHSVDGFTFRFYTEIVN